MGTLRSDLKLRGLGLPDRKITLENLNPSDGSATASDFDEAGPRPGTAVGDDPKSSLLVEISNAQGEDLEVYVARSGTPSPAGPAEILFRESDEAGTLGDGWRAWNRGNWLHSIGQKIAATSSFDGVVIPSSQTLLVGWNDGAAAKVSVYDGEWSLAGNTVDPAGGVPKLVVLPSERVLAYVGDLAYFSDDDGATWSLYSTSTGLPSGERSRVVLSGETLLALVQDAGPAPFMTKQLVSTDLGVTFQELEETDIGRYVEPVVLPDGSIGVFSMGTAFTNQPLFRRLGSPFDLLSDATFASIAFVDVDFLVGAVTPDGVLWSIVDLDATDGDHRVYRSTDSGETWETLEESVFTMGASGPRPPNGKLLSVDGSFAWLTQWHDDPSATDFDFVGVLWLGGWQNIGADPGVGWGLSSAAFPLEIDVLTFVPTNTPQTPWGVNGAGTHSADGVELQIDTVAQTRFYARAFSGGANEVVELVTVDLESGGSQVTTQCGFEVRVADGVNDRAFEVNLEIDAGIGKFSVRDLNSAAVLFTVTYGTATNLRPSIQFKFHLSNGFASEDLRLFWRLDRPEAQWQVAYDGALTNETGSPAANGDLKWGHVQSGTASSAWKFVTFKTGNGSMGVKFVRTDVEEKRGASIGGLGFPLGFVEELPPNARTNETDAVFCSLRGGPARVAEAFTIPTAYDFGVENLFAELSPSGRSTWRSKTRRPTSFSWSFPVPTRVGDSWILGVLIDRPNFRTAFVDFDTSGGGTWVQVGEINLAQGFEGLTFVRDGDRVRPDSAGSLTADRYLDRNELAGGLFVDSLQGVRIQGNTSGRWTDASSGPTVVPVVNLEEVGSIGASGTCDIIPPRALFVLHLDAAAANFVRGIRIRLDDSLVVNGEDFLEAGMIRPIAFVPFGQQPSRGWSQEMTPNTSETVSRSGTIRKRQEGPPARRWSWSWPDGVKLDQIRGVVAPDFLGLSGKPPAIVKEDVWGLLWGILEETKGTEIPVVACNVLPTVPTGTTINDRTLFLLGTLDGSGRFDHVLGDEGANEFGRLPPVSIRELI